MHTLVAQLVVLILVIPFLAFVILVVTMTP